VRTNVLEFESRLARINIGEDRRRDAFAAGQAGQSGLERRSLAAEPTVEFGVAVGLGLAVLGDAAGIRLEGNERFGPANLVFSCRARTAPGRELGFVSPPCDRNLIRPKVGVDTRVLERERVARGVHLRAEDGDHPRVVSQEAGLGRVELGTALGAHLREHFPEAGVLADTAAEDEFVAASQGQGALGHLGQHPEDVLLEGVADVLDRRARVGGLLRGAHDSRKGEVHSLDDVGEIDILAPLAASSTFGPPGWDQPTWRVNLSIALPTPVSIVSPRTR